MQINQSFTVSYQYPVIFTEDTFSSNNQSLIKLIDNLSDRPEFLLCLDSEVAACHPELSQKVADYLAAAELKLSDTLIIPGGEDCKNHTQWLEDIYQAVADYKIDRHSYIIVVGGGAVVDAVGYAAATAHRGIRLIRLPSTVLGQNDAGVGVKNAINFNKRKNYLGTFVPPFAVINDFTLLNSLQVRDKRCGIAEAIKVALIKDKEFFNQLYADRFELAQFETAAMKNMIIKGAKWHLDHIATNGDPFEFGSARPLDFGHWSAHKLEELSNNELRHGEAVAIGIAIDSLYSVYAGHLTQADANKIITLLTTLGFTLNHSALQQLDVEQALNEFKEHLGGRLCITLLNNLGSGFEANHINSEWMKKSIAQLQSSELELAC
ncbi:3-dehydroquinate synthase [Gayadomonas joobiniege]|uniref:3-dehydroquinate synthase n=1 Tax=Gayadomonas joobiniege TaxID=1234606 RepID=UPI000374842D|nr:3-dehydroquinate synthase [Gayadomonas joobiniege]